MKITPYTPTFFPTLDSWWQKHHGKYFLPECIPTHAYIGIIDDQPVCFFGIAPMNEHVAYFSFPIVNPFLIPKLRNQAVDFMIDQAKILSENAGFSILWISTHGEKFLNRLKNGGFKADEGLNTHLLYRIKE